MSRYLLRPARHEISIRVNCEPPKSLELHWSQENNTLLQHQLINLPRSKIINKEKLNYVLVNSEHYLRYLQVSKDLLAFYNHSSIQTEVTSSNEKMVKISPVNFNYNLAVLD